VGVVLITVVYAVVNVAMGLLYLLRVFLIIQIALAEINEDGLIK
jgi:hypothetical protein